MTRQEALQKRQEFFKKFPDYKFFLVAKIKLNKLSQKIIANEYGITEGYMSLIVNGLRYNPHVVNFIEGLPQKLEI